MRPASRRALLRRLGAVAPTRATWIGSVVALISLAMLLVAIFARPPHEAIQVAPATQRGAPVLDPVLALPFGEGDNNASVPPSATPAAGNGPIEELRAAYRSADDRQQLFRQLKQRTEPDAKYLAFRAARDCGVLLSGSGLAELDAVSERRGERERQMVAASRRCTGFVNEPAAPDELQRLEQEAAQAGHPAAQIALATETFAQHSLGETLDVLRRGLASADPFAFDEARVLLAMNRYQAEIAGIAPTADANIRRTDARVAAIDLVSCRLGNPCGPAGIAAVFDCGGSGACQRDAEQWLLQIEDLDDDERRSALALADQLLGAFKRGAVDEIVRLPAAAPAARR